MSDNQAPLSEPELAAAIDLLRQIIPDEELERLAPTGPATVYTTTITLWMLILQRLGNGKTLNAVVKIGNCCPTTAAFAKARCPKNREPTVTLESGCRLRLSNTLPTEFVTRSFSRHRRGMEIGGALTSTALL